jgi:hypothetical protein
MTTPDSAESIPARLYHQVDSSLSRQDRAFEQACDTLRYWEGSQDELRSAARHVLERCEQWRALANAAMKQGIGDAVGAPMTIEEDEGGLRGYLHGQPLHAGCEITLLTHQGWLSGGYEYRYDREAGLLNPIFVCTIPGGDDTVGFRLPPQALLAWPSELQRSQGRELLVSYR